MVVPQFASTMASKARADARLLVVAHSWGVLLCLRRNFSLLYR